MVLFIIIPNRFQLVAALHHIISVHVLSHLVISLLQFLHFSRSLQHVFHVLSYHRQHSQQSFYQLPIKLDLHHLITSWHLRQSLPFSKKRTNFFMWKDRPYFWVCVGVNEGFFSVLFLKTVHCCWDADRWSRCSLRYLRGTWSSLLRPYRISRRSVKMLDLKGAKTSLFCEFWTCREVPLPVWLFSKHSLSATRLALNRELSRQ